MTPLCKNCTHFKEHKSWLKFISKPVCAHPSRLSPIYGNPLYTCHECRVNPLCACGPRGEQFEINPLYANNWIMISPTMKESGNAFSVIQPDKITN